MQHVPLDREVMIKLENKQLSLSNLKTLSGYRQEPDWLLQLREKSFTTFQSLPMPGRKDEEWRRTDIRGLEYDTYNPIPATDHTNLTTTGEQHENFLMMNGNTIIQKQNNKAANSGCIWTDLHTAAQKYPELVKKYFTLAQTLNAEDKFSALNSAFHNSGVFVYIPANYHLESPLHISLLVEQIKTLHCPRTIIVLAEGSSMTYFQQLRSAQTGQQMFVNGVVDIFLEKGAKLEYVSMQDLHNKVYNFSHKRAFVKADASMNWFVGTFGSRLTKSVISSVLQEKGASTEMNGISVGEVGEFIEQNTYQIHEAANTKSNLLFKTAIKDNGYAVYRGVIRIAEVAQKSDAYQSNKNLMLGQKARAESIPALEIIANDVRCTHGATVSKVEPEHLFYLQCRGIDPAAAKRLIVEGFFDTVLQKISNKEIGEKIQNTIHSKMNSL